MIALKIIPNALLVLRTDFVSIIDDVKCEVLCGKRNDNYDFY